jgi:hypothetical protein
MSGFCGALPQFEIRPNGNKYNIPDGISTGYTYDYIISNSPTKSILGDYDQ